MAPSAGHMRSRLNLLVQGMTGLRHEGRFDEPNLDGTAGDYISFNSWEWPQGVGLYGLVSLWRHNRDPKLLKTIEAWYERHFTAGLPPMNINTTAPMMALALLWRETRDARWAQPLGEWADRLLREMPRTPEGGLQHNVSDKINDDELWDDTLFMAGLFLAFYGRAAGRQACVDEAVRQFLRACPLPVGPENGAVVSRLDLRRQAQFRARAVGPRQCLDHSRHPGPGREWRHRQAGRSLPARRARRRRSMRCSSCRRLRAPGIHCSTILRPTKKCLPRPVSAMG